MSSTTAPVTNPGLNSFENVGGCLQVVNLVQPQSKNAFVGNNATTTNITNSNLAALTFLFENATALNTLSGCGNSLPTPQGWNCAAGLGVATTVTADTTMDTSAQIWPCNASTGMVKLTVPKGSTVPGRMFTVKKVDTSANTCKVMMSGAETIDGSGSYSLTGLNNSVSFTNMNGSTTWYITGSH